MIVSLILVLGIILWRNNKAMVIISPIAHVLPQSRNAMQSDRTIQQVQEGLVKRNIIFTSIVLDNDETIHLLIKDQGEVLFTSAKNIDMQITSLQLTMNDLTIEGKPFKRLDFRFDKPIVTF